MTNITTNPISRRTLFRYGSSAIALRFLGSVLPARATFAERGRNNFRPFF